MCITVWLRVAPNSRTRISETHRDTPDRLITDWAISLFYTSRRPTSVSFCSILITVMRTHRRSNENTQFARTNFLWQFTTKQQTAFFLRTGEREEERKCPIYKNEFSMSSRMQSVDIRNMRTAHKDNIVSELAPTSAALTCVNGARSRKNKYL